MIMKLEDKLALALSGLLGWTQGYLERAGKTSALDSYFLNNAEAALKEWKERKKECPWRKGECP